MGLGQVKGAPLRISGQRLIKFALALSPSSTRALLCK